MSTATSLSLNELSPPEVSAEAHTQEQAERPWLDRIGITASVACAIHCMVAPFLLLLLPAAGTVWAHPAVHWGLAVLVVPLALWVIFRGYRKHKKQLTLYAALIGAACIVAGLISPMVYSQALFSTNVPTFGLFHESLMPMAGAACTEVCCPTATYNAQAQTLAVTFPPGGLVTLIGSLFLVFAHGTNLIACRCYRKETVDDACGSACGCPSA